MASPPNCSIVSHYSPRPQLKGVNGGCLEKRCFTQYIIQLGECLLQTDVLFLIFHPNVLNEYYTILPYQLRTFFALQEVNFN